MAPAHTATVTRALDMLEDLHAHAEALRETGFDAEAAIRKLSLLLLQMEAEEADGCLPPRAWSDVIRFAGGR